VICLTAALLSASLAMLRWQWSSGRLDFPAVAEELSVGTPAARVVFVATPLEEMTRSEQNQLGCSADAQNGLAVRRNKMTTKGDSAVPAGWLAHTQQVLGVRRSKIK
jgi:hypothetical protein